MTKDELIAYNKKLKHDYDNGYITVYWSIVRDSKGNIIEDAGTSGWCWGHKTDLNPHDYTWKYFKSYNS